MTTQTDERTATGNLIGQSACIERLRSHVVRAASYDVNLLLQGESGVGKELVARSVHRLSSRRNGPFVGVNCAAIHESLLESELFGHEAGSFTGAGQGTLGFFRAAEGGTILLDEVGDMSEALQRKLLRVLEERAVIPVGGTRAVPIDIRVIAASNRDLAKAIREGSFRSDLYYRLNVLCLWIAPLRQRRSDIPLLADHFLSQTASALQVPRKQFSPSAMSVLMNYSWPGNIRELLNVIKRAYVLCDDSVVEVDDLADELTEQAADSPGRFPKLGESIRLQVSEALALSGGVRSQAAEMLGIGRSTLWRMLQRYDIG